MSTTEQATYECIVELRVWTSDGPTFDHLVKSMTLNEIAHIECAIRHPSDTTITALVRWDG